MARQPHPFCIRLPDDLRAAVVDLANRNGVNASELMRGMIYRAVYNEPMTPDDGYLHGRAVAYGIFMDALARTMQSMPSTIEEATLAGMHGNPKNPDGTYVLNGLSDPRDDDR